MASRPPEDALPARRRWAASPPPGLLDRVRALLWDERVLRSPLARAALPVWELFFRLFSLPGIRERHPWFSPRKNTFSWIPVHEPVGSEPGVPLTEQVLFPFIDRASHRVVLNLCGCRQTRGCSEYPRDLGCLMLGDDALLFPEKFRRVVSRQEAREHVRRAVAAGLVPVAGKARLDNEIFLMPDRGKLLTVCFCCECCCVSRFFRHLPVPLLDSFYLPLQGLAVHTDAEACTGCGACVERCYIGALSIRDGKAVRSDRCRGCGRCATFCPSGAVTLHLQHPGAAEEMIRRVEAYVDYGQGPAAGGPGPGSP